MTSTSNPSGPASAAPQEKAATLRTLHVSGDPLVLPNAWDAASARMVEATGAVGLNLEDSDPPTGEMIDAAEQADFLAAVRSAAASAGVDLVINARTDSFLRRAGSSEEQLAASIDRGARYLAAGADCVFPIAATDPDVIRALVEGIPGPVNAGYGQGKHSLADLAALGVARVSFGPTLQRHLYDKFASGLLAAVASDKTPFVL